MDLDGFIQPALDMLESCITFEPSYWETREKTLLEGNDVYILGKEITKQNGPNTIRNYVTSRLWFTYRKNFPAIGGTGPESDQGWGCMLRCAQMVLGETLLRRHIGRDYKWKRDTQPEGDYEKILRMFLDEKSALYSIHQIAQMGVSEGKAVGEWFGPNTAAQVLKKLAVFDSWSNIAVHVAMDNIVIDSDVRMMATVSPPSDAVKLILENSSLDESHMNSMNAEIPDAEEASASGSWRPLLLIIPLRLGLTTINKVYLPAVQKFFKLETCVGIIGGRPNRALYFVGISGEKLIYLDPHYCRPSITGQRRPVDGYDDGFDHLEEPQPSLITPDGEVATPLDDSSYHCDLLLYMDYEEVDPSLALCLFCESEEVFERTTKELKENVLTASKPPLFELLDQRPKGWPPFEPYFGVKTKIEMNEFHDMGDPNFSQDDDFEVLES
ncbi:hypothetical protein WR25_06057 [Diploscapter pachys]|uniref:Cysteine protease n=1 Tax=Diploscapter pachys TaxID=2018661 RepID=A0A2A2J2S0_9BILA|nr:hypothetical protein WR25_06057 [Diploscapter pachys]